MFCGGKCESTLSTLVQRYCE